eukprot:Gb_10673 [translate_table: standard]
MRIRKRWDSSSAFGNTKTCSSTPAQPQPYDAADSHQEQEHLLPLLQTTAVELADCTGPRQRHKQPSNGVQKWKQALQLNSEFTKAYSHLPRATEPELRELMEAVRGTEDAFTPEWHFSRLVYRIWTRKRMVMAEWSVDAVECKGSSSLRNQGENMGDAPNQDKSVDAAATKEGSPDQNGITSDHHVLKSSRFPQTSSSYTQQLVQLGEGSKYSRPVCSLPLKKRKKNIKETPSADDSHCATNGWRDRDKMFPVSIKHPKAVKADITDEESKDGVNSRKEMNNKNKSQTAGKMSECSGGSQCRRMNGRGWRCSQRTLVGYALCEHHLGKGRLKSINTTHHLHTTNACKDLQLMPSNAMSTESQDLIVPEEKKKRMVKARSLKLISL